MKSKWILVLLAVIPSALWAQSYGVLWKQVDDAGKKDLPKTQIATLDKIASKAEKSGDYGQLLSARLMSAGLQATISPDSADVELARLETLAGKAEAKDPVLAAVYHTVLGRIYSRRGGAGEGYAGKGKDYFRKAMSNPGMLARHKASEYTPLISKNKDSEIFGDDLLHVIGMETKDYETLYNYYKGVGNRPAACIIASLWKNTVAELDSMIEVYGDLPEAGELAKKHYTYMRNVSAEAKVGFIDYALDKWKDWELINTLANERKRLTNPTFTARFENKVSIPGKACKVSLGSIRNVSELTMKISLLGVNGDTELSPVKDYDQLVRQVKQKDICVQTRTYTGKKDYEYHTDSILVEGLPIGVYLVDFYADGKRLENATVLYYVSNLYVMSEGLPDKKTRCVVVDATTGQPVPGATLKCMSNRKNAKTYKYTTDKNGEVVTDGNVFSESTRKFVYTDKDKASPDQLLWSNYYYHKDNKSFNIPKVYTDRSIYRPGQDVHVAVVVFNSKGRLETSVVADKEVQVYLRDANSERIGEKTVKTDKYGTAHVDFTLPQTGLTGNYSIEAVCGQTAWQKIHVEEYKRPSFRIEFPGYKEKYSAGDTVTVKAYAKTYAGMPVQGAKVEYSVNRRRAFWCWWVSSEYYDAIFDGEAVTDEEGAFEMKMPMEMPDEDDYGDDAVAFRRGVFFNFVADAKVTDTGGESHSGTFSLPLGTKSTALSCDLPEKELGDSLRQVTFSYTNAAGKPIDGSVSFTLGGREYKNRKANAPVAVSALEPGRHRLFAVCGNDTIEQDIIVFSLKDKKPVVETDDWFYVSAAEFPSDGKPVCLQVGSSAEAQHIVYNVFSGNKVIESGVIDQGNALHNRAFTYKEEYGDGIRVTYAWVKNGEMYEHSADIKKPLPDKRLLLEWKTFRDRLVPGQEEEWTLQVTHPGGKPADALLIASMYDKSLDQIYSHNWTVGLGLYRSMPGVSWAGSFYSSLYARYNADLKTVSVRSLSFDRFDNKYFNALEYYGSPLYNQLYGAVNGIQVRKSNLIRVRGTGNMSVKEAPEADVVAGTTADSAPLDEVVIVGYGTEKKEAATGAVAIERHSLVNEEGKSGSSFDDVQLRENLNETAFFYPDLTTDASGHISMKFRLPESVTTWKFLGYAHDKDMNHGFINGEAVARKTVMVQPNMPRFVRVADKAQIAARLFNSSENAVSGKARIELVDPETDAVVYSDTKDYTISANGTSKVSFALDMPSVVESLPRSVPNSNISALSSTLLVCRIMAVGDGYSDGEQHYLPILPDMEMVTNTVPFTQNGAGVKEIDLEKLFPKGIVSGNEDRGLRIENGNINVVSSKKEGMSNGNIEEKADINPQSSILNPRNTFSPLLTIEYTNNPAWLMIQALPYVGNVDEDNAISLVSAFYANSLAGNMMNSSPKIKQVFDQWRAEKGSGTSLMSSLQKDQSLKELVLSETPWVADAKNEAEQKQSLAQFFNGNNISNRLSSTLKGLTKLQNGDGSWSWWSGMDGSPWMTVSVCRTLARLNRLIGVQEDTDGMLRNGMAFLAKVIREEVAELKKEEGKGNKDLVPSELALNYLYVRSLDTRNQSGGDAQDVAYLVKLLARNTSRLTIYGKANSAIILARNGYMAKAKTFLQSLKEYSVYTEETGRYFDTRKAYYSWFDYRIPTETAAIEALQTVTPQDTKTVEEMQRWLLQEKRTQAWDTPVNSVDAVYAFFCGQGTDGDNIFGDKLAAKEQVVLKLDGKPVELPKATAGIGYVKTAVPAADAKVFTAEKTSEGTSWGTVYAQFMQSAADIDGAASGIRVKREVFVVAGKNSAKERKTEKDGSVSLKVGDKVRVVITVTADRDYDFVQVADKRAACLEPAEQLSGYRHGYYCAPKDYTTNYYFDRMRKGKHVIETEYYVDRAGEYGTGTCTAQCAYSPGYTGRTKADKFKVYEND